MLGPTNAAIPGYLFRPVLQFLFVYNLTVPWVGWHWFTTFSRFNAVVLFAFQWDLEMKSPCRIS